MKLIIVESPTKAKTIQKYLGKDYTVIASSGHIRDLPERTLGISIDKDFEPGYVISKDKKEIIKKLKSAVKSSDDIYLATDPDREGEAISWHLKEVLELPDETKRIVFNEISTKSVNAAINSPREINMNLVNAQQARRVLDRLVGYKVSPILNKQIKSGLSGGRVQSSALKMVVDREREIRAFVPEEYWNIYAFTTQENKVSAFRSSLADHNGKKIKVNNEEENSTIIGKVKGANWSVDTVKRGVSKSHPGAPFTTSTLQQDGSARLSISAPEVMKIAQQLYEGINVEGEGHIALVTYIRTDSVRISEDAQKEAIEYIKNNFGKEYAPKKPNVYKSKGAIQDAHEAIRPISLDMTPEIVKSKVNRNQYRLYKLIYNRFLASQMADAQYNTLNVRVKAECSVEDEYGFKLSGKTVLFKGYTVAYEIEKGDEEDNSNRLPNLIEGEKLDLKELKFEQKFTKAPSRYTEATLVKAMEENGIGRPSTYANVMSVLPKRDYTEKEGKSIKPTNLGETVVEFMESNFDYIVDSKFTAKMEADLDSVEQGIVWVEIIKKFYPKFYASINKAYAGEKKMKVEPEVTDVVCDKCGAFMVVRSGRYGKFLACPRYPECKNIKNIVEDIGKCPRCGGEIVKKRTKNGKIFYGCGNYPTCDFMSWEVPAPIFCPECSSTMRIVKSNGEEKYICTNKKCNHTILVKKDKEDDSEE